MRVEFCNALLEVLSNDERSLIITGDLGYSAFETIAASVGKRFLNAGVAEQNMMGLAAGLALSGFRPWVYSIASFVTFRCLEQIRNDVCLHNLPVRIVGNGGGFTYGVLGSTHHALEDLGVLKGFPNITLFFPCGNDHVAAAVEMMDGFDSPSYLRLAVSPFAVMLRPLSENPVTLTRHYQRGEALTILGVGHAVQIVLAALEHCGLRRLNVDVFGIARYPLDLQADEMVVLSVQKTRRVLVVEEHYQAGGMGESLKAALPNTDYFRILAPYYRLEQRYGSARFHLQQCQLTPENITQQIAELFDADQPTSDWEGLGKYVRQGA